MDRAYINRKILNCEKLIAAANTDAQKKIYQGYLDFWTKKLPKPVEIIIEADPLELKFLEEGEEDLEEAKYANIFEIENAPKQAYYNRDGKTNKTKAFKEYLNQRTQ